MFPSISPKQSFPALESEILAYWKDNNTFRKSIDSRPAENPYRFYDGPPFITGMPHYGHLLGSTVKDAVGRYWTMRGYRVERVWGWDCHGLPIEERVQKKFGLASNADIEKLGVKKFIDECYTYTSEVSSEWEWYIDKIGRWVDMEHPYRTMDQDYMESVMWVFRQLWDKGLIYEGKRVSLYSWKLGTPISNFEVAMDDTYQEVNDPAITVKFTPDTVRACGIIVKNNDGKILLGHNKKGFWSFPGGKAEGNETHEQCATRELFEETKIVYEITEKDSINVDQYDIIGGVIFDNRRYEIHVGDWEPQNGEPEKFYEWKFYDPSEFPENMFEPSKYAYDLVVSGMKQKNLPLFILAWTTTPWTIPANMALAVGNDIDYILVENGDEQFIVAKNRAESVFKGKGAYTILREFKGSELVGLRYIPPFPEYYYQKNNESNNNHVYSIVETKSTNTDKKELTLIEGVDGYEKIDASIMKFPLKANDVAMGWIVDDNDHLLLGWSKKYNNWHFVGGRNEEGETQEECMIREIREEIGINVSTQDLVQEMQNIGIDKKLWRSTYFRVKIDSSQVINKEPDLITEFKWFSREELQKIYPTLRNIDQGAIDIYLGNSAKKSLTQISFLSYNHTPGSIGENMALAVGNDIDYILVENGDEQFIVAKNRAESVFKGKGAYTILREFKGSELVGLRYILPEYYYQKHRDKNHRIYHADFITDTDGTGIGHEAPEFGDVDFQLAKKEGITITEAMDGAGKYTSQIFDYEGLHYQEANKINIERMKENGTLFKNESITHRVPFCPRSATPLVQKAQKSWFIDIQSQKEKLLRANEQINWFPEHLKFGRFAKGIESAPDWCISRTRYWGAPMPVWQNTDGTERVVVSSREEIFEMNKPYGQLTKLIITRHAESECNVKGHYDDDGTSPLSQKGFEQSEKLMHDFKDKGVDIIIASPFLRAIQTAESLAKALGIEIITDERLRETQRGIFHNAVKTPETKKMVTDTLFGDNKDEKVGENGESYNEIKSRMNAFITRICNEYPGKTIFVVTHGYQIEILRQSLTEKGNFIYPKNATPLTFILDVANKKQLNLHKPYIDSILLAPKETKKPKKVLGIHGFRRTENVVDFFTQTAKNLKFHEIEVNCPRFEEGEAVNYENWRNVFMENIDGVDTIFAHSLGCRFSLDMVIKQKISLKRLILVAPPEGKHERLQEFLSHLQEDVGQIKKYVEEVIILYSLDDKEGRVEASKQLIEKTGCHAIRMNGFGHFNLHESKLIEGLIQYGTPLTRISEVLDVWMDSGSMPYAQVHFPFAGFEDASIKKAETNEEKELCFSFFEKMWKEEFDMGFHNRPNNSYEDIRDDFWKSDIFYIAEGNQVISSIQIAIQTKENPFVPIGSAGLWRVGTMKEYRGKGYGTKLIKKALSQFAKQGAQEVYLSAEIKLIDFYKSFGFIQIQDIPEKCENTKSVYMKKTLSKADELQSLTFPADFIAEYVGQVRAWFYVMHVLGVLLNPNNEPTPTPSFTNVITTGVINGNDGRKMSKSYGNYPDPRATIEKYGADPIRFYMLNSPLLSGGDMDFKEEGIIETIKSVMLPLWNTYSFFTTYANIDQWEHTSTELYFVRHGETDHNKTHIMNGGDIDTPLNEHGKKQAYEAGKRAKEKGMRFDIIVSSPLSRAYETAEIIARETGYTGDIVKIDGLLEQLSGKFAGKTISEIGEAIGNPDVTAIRRAYKEDNGVENIEQFEARVIPTFQKILSENPGKKILISAHTGTFRPIYRHLLNTTREEAHYRNSIPHAEIISLPITPIVNHLDRWILSKLQVLLGQVHDAMDAYDVSRATHSIIEYMDELTNWYVRLSRRRFWGSEMTDDKKSAYETLYTVLREMSKLLAPFMPFMSEAIYKGLTDINPLFQESTDGKNVGDFPKPENPQSPRSSSTAPFGKELLDNSVHLQYATFPNRHLISAELNRDMEVAEHIVSLGLTLRSRKNIRVRQPLQSVTITKKLDEYYLAIIRDELNVKEIHYENPEKLAKKICKPDARKIGPKYGKDVQSIISLAKSGNFIEQDNGDIIVMEMDGSEEKGKTLKEKVKFLLHPDEYTIEYLPLEGTKDVEGGYGMVIAMNTDITESLRLEGYARDIIRQIQEMRKEADYQVTDHISLHISGGKAEGSGESQVDTILEKFGSMIEHETLSLFSDFLTHPDIEKTIELDTLSQIIIQVYMEKQTLPKDTLS